MATRAGIVVTGTEVLTGRVSDRNGPWLAEQLRLLGVDVAQVVVVGDRPADLRDALRFLIGAGVDLVITSGGLGPTADDLTAEIVGEVQGRSSELDGALQSRIAEIVTRISADRGWRLDPAATAAGVRKQALVPTGATVLEPVGTAPGLVVPPPAGAGTAPVIVLPGPPRELQGMWPAAVGTELVQTAIAGRVELRQHTIRLWGTPESELAQTLRDLGSALDDLEITTCLRDGELEIVTRYEPDAQPAYDQLAAELTTAYSDTLFSADGRTIDEIVAQELTRKNKTIATAESCTSGLLAGRLTELPGSSAFLLGGLVVYSNRAKHELAGVPEATLQEVGAVSPEVALALADGARGRLHTDIGVGITGIAGPDGGRPDKPVGLVYVCATTAERSYPRRLQLPGDRHDIRARTVAITMQLIRTVVTEL